MELDGEETTKERMKGWENEQKKREEDEKGKKEGREGKKEKEKKEGKKGKSISKLIVSHGSIAISK